MASVINTNSQWEVAGKRTLRKNGNLNGSLEQQQTNGTLKTKKANGTSNGTKNVLANMPKLETLPPLKPDSTIYDLIRDSDDDEMERPNTRLNAKNKAAVQQTIVLSSSMSDAQTPSPKNKKKQQQQNNNGEIPLNLLSASQMANKKKTSNNTSVSGASAQSVKKLESELESLIAGLKLDDFQMELNKLKAIFPNSMFLIIESLVTTLNQKLSSVPELEPTTDTKTIDPRSLLKKLDKNLEKFFNNLISKCTSMDQYKLFEQFFHVLLNDTGKPMSSHGYKLFIQLLISQVPNVFMGQLEECKNAINANKHRHQRCLIALWSIGQAGYLNLSNGIKIWFETMLPFIQVKNVSKYAVWYLSSLFEFNNITAKTTINNNKMSNQQHQQQKSINDIREQLVTIEQYIQFYDLINDKQMNLQKDYQTKLNSSYQIVRNLFLQEINQNAEYNFEELMANLMRVDTGSQKEMELIDLAVKCVVSSQSKQVLNRWKKIYSRYPKQSFQILERLTKTNNKCFKQLKGLNEFVFFLDEQLTSKLSQFTKDPVSSPNSKQYYIKKSQKASNEVQFLQANNVLIKQIIRQNYQRASILSMVLRAAFYITIALTLFFVWDVNKNKSIYTNSVQKQLEKHGLLEPTLKLINTVSQFITNLKSSFNHYFPIWYRKTYQTVAPLAKSAWENANYYANLAWKGTEEFRATIVGYYNELVDYVYKNYPTVLKNLQSVVELAINYFVTLSNLFLYYLNHVANLVESQLGWKKGEIEHIITDTFKFLLNQITIFFDWLNKLTEEPATATAGKIPVKTKVN